MRSARHLPAAICEQQRRCRPGRSPAIAVAIPATCGPRPRSRFVGVGSERTRLATSMPSASAPARRARPRARRRAHDAANDLAGEVLVALRQQHFREVRAHLVRVRARARCRNSSPLTMRRSLRPRSCDRGTCHASISSPAPRALRRPAARMLHEVERAMRGFVGELEHVVRRLRASGTSFSASASRRASRAEAPQRRLRLRR